MDKERGVDAPMSLKGLFPDSSDEENAGEEGGFEQVSEVQTLMVADQSLQVRQLAYHSHNANRVWPGTFVLAEYLVQHDYHTRVVQDAGGLERKLRFLEIGSATGALAMALVRQGMDVTTCDYDDDEIAENIRFNFENNDMIPVPHVGHTWGSDWNESYGNFEVVIASDILLYVSAYPALVNTLVQLFDKVGCEVFIMAWNRRLKDSHIFFESMESSGFTSNHEGSCVYKFVKTA